MSLQLHFQVFLDWDKILINHLSIIVGLMHH